MPGLFELWLPILAASVFVFVASSVLHMCMKYHWTDYGPVPKEEDLRTAVRGQGLAPGTYMFPFCTSVKEMAAPEHMAKLNEGPNGLLTVLPNGPPNMGKSLVQWFAYSVVVSLMVGYVGTMGLAEGEDFMPVFRLTAAAALIGYALANATDSIWKGVSWSVTAKFFFDGVVYSLATGLAFGLLWP